MCGIAGIMHHSAPGAPDEELLCGMVSILHHRGPDEAGIYVDRQAGLGHARLSIIGLNDGTQPIANEDESLWIVFNGEIFNYLELRRELLERGHRFRTSSDTEVILHLFEEKGAACLQELNGQFAFAIWNTLSRELFLARDRVGIRPLFTTFHKGRFLFASEIKALFVSAEIPRVLDLEALQQVFTCWTTLGERTPFQGVEQLPPGHYQFVRCNERPRQPQPYWRIPWFPDEEQWAGSREEAIEELRALLVDAVRLRLRADVPVGAYLSGGLDSSILTSIIARRFNNRLKTFSLGFEDGHYDEAVHQRQMVEALVTDHHQVTVKNSDVRERFADVIWHCERPLLRTGPVPLHMLSGLVRAHRFKVVLTGEGADEVFGGYNIFKEAKVRSFWARQPASKRRPALVARLYPYLFTSAGQGGALLQKFFAVTPEALNDPLISHRKRWETAGKCRLLFSADVQRSLQGVDPLYELEARLPVGFGERSVFARAQWLEMEIFLANYLLSSQGDRVAMSNSLELRMPYLDHRLIEFAARLPDRWKMPGLKEKHLLKLAWRGELPASIVARPKQPYRAPAAAAFAPGGASGPLEMLCIDQLARAGIFDVRKVERLFAKQQPQAAQAASEVHNMAVVGVLSTQLLHEQFIEQRPRPATMIAPDRVVRRQRRCDRDAMTPGSAWGYAHEEKQRGRSYGLE